MSSQFTEPETWKGGHFELFIQPGTGSSDDVRSLLKALWSFPTLDGCYVHRDREPSTQERVTPRENNSNGHLYGSLALPNGKVVACGSYASDYDGEEGVPRSHYVSFYLPLGALSSIYNVGTYPFGSMDNVMEWKLPVQSFLADLGRWIFHKMPFEYALIGFEATPDPILLQRVRSGDIPDEQNEGMLWNDSGVLKWFSATRP